MEGLLDPTAQMGASGRSERWLSRAYNIAFRFGGPDGSKLRARDGLKRRTTNLQCQTKTTIQLDSRGDLGRLSRLTQPVGGDWGLF